MHTVWPVRNLSSVTCEVARPSTGPCWQPGSQLNPPQECPYPNGGQCVAFANATLQYKEVRVAHLYTKARTHAYAIGGSPLGSGLWACGSRHRLHTSPQNGLHAARRHRAPQQGQDSLRPYLNPDSGLASLTCRALHPTSRLPLLLGPSIHHPLHHPLQRRGAQVCPRSAMRGVLASINQQTPATRPPDHLFPPLFLALLLVFGATLVFVRFAFMRGGRRLARLEVHIKSPLDVFTVRPPAARCGRRSSRQPCAGGKRNGCTGCTVCWCNGGVE